MIIKINEETQYEVEYAKKACKQILAQRSDGSEIVIGGDFSGIEVIGGEIAPETEATPEQRITELEEALELLLSGVTE